MKIVTITNQKGGVGKTTTSHILSCGLSGRGFRVLAVDSDPQMNLTYSAGTDDYTKDLYDVVKGLPVAEAIQKTNTGYDIIPGSLNLAGADMELSFTGREYIFRKILQPVKEKYDFIIIDTPPTLGILTVNALTVSGSVLIPMKADIFSLQGLSQLWGLIQNIREYTNPDISVSGLLLNQYSNRATLNKELKLTIEDLTKTLKTGLYKAQIREAVAVRECITLHNNLFTDYPKAKVTEDYNSFIDEFLEKEGIK